MSVSESRQWWNAGLNDRWYQLSAPPGRSRRSKKRARWRDREQYGDYARPWNDVSLTYQERRRLWRRYVHDLYGASRPKNEREWRFVYGYVCAVLKQATRAKGKVNLGTMRDAAKVAVAHAGYPEKRDRAVATRATEMLDLPRIQAGIMDTFATMGVDVEKCGRVLGEIMDAPLHSTVTAEGVTTSTGVVPGDKLRAVDLYFRVTTGLAPTKSASVTEINHRRDRFFDESKFTAPPPPALIEHEES